MNQIITHTLGDLRHELQGLLSLPDYTLVTFGHGDLQFYRLKNRGPVEGPAVINFEFSTLYRVTQQV
ncbi:MAG: hypothetical protein MUF08_16995 [Burkholderiaceae bacterium]|jgi:hypothetical protein|nr:hypothetical protein [Burkholderiaceae bacterium]